MERPRCSVFIAVSLDGCIARSDGAIDWLDRVQRPGEDYGFAAFFSSVDALLMGRNTYDVAAGFPEWPYAGKQVVVLTHRPAAPREGVRFASGSPEEIVAGLGGLRRVYVDGGDVIQQLLAAGLIDDLTLSVIPVLLGDGIRLFGRGEEHGLELEESKSWPGSGLVQLRYRVARRP